MPLSARDLMDVYREVPWEMQLKDDVAASVFTLCNSVGVLRKCHQNEVEYLRVSNEQSFIMNFQELYCLHALDK